MINFTQDQLDIVKIGVLMYKKKCHKLLKSSEEVKAGEKDIKQHFLEADALLVQLNDIEL